MPSIPRSRETLHTNPFDDDGGMFSVLVNAGEQHSLWPAAVEMPEGWRPVFGVATRAECLDFVERHWADIAPRSVPEAIGQASSLASTSAIDAPPSRSATSRS